MKRNHDAGSQKFPSIFIIPASHANWRRGNEGEKLFLWNHPSDLMNVSCPRLPRKNRSRLDRPLCYFLPLRSWQGWDVKKAEFSVLASINFDLQSNEHKKHEKQKCMEVCKAQRWQTAKKKLSLCLMLAACHQGECQTWFCRLAGHFWGRVRDFVVDEGWNYRRE